MRATWLEAETGGALTLPGQADAGGGIGAAHIAVRTVWQAGAQPEGCGAVGPCRGVLSEGWLSHGFLMIIQVQSGV